MTKRKGSARKTAASPLTAEDVTARATDIIFSEFQGVVEGLIVAAKTGNATCAKFLAEFSGLYPRGPEAAAFVPDGFAADLLRRVETTGRDDTPVDALAGDPAPGGHGEGAANES